MLFLYERIQAMYERFLTILEKSGFNTADVAKVTGIHPSTFTDWKKGKSSPKADKLKNLADFFGVPLSYFLEEENANTGIEYVRLLCKEAKIAISQLEKECGFSNGYLNPKKATKIPYERAMNIRNFFASQGVDADINRILGVSTDVANTPPCCDYMEINDILANTKRLLNKDGLLFNGSPAPREAVEAILLSLDIGKEYAKKSCEKYA
jgi:repressor LexA